MNLETVKVVAKALIERAESSSNASDGTDNSSISGLTFSLCRIPVNISSPTCVKLNSDTQALALFNFLLALFVTIGLQFIQRRVKQCPNCLWGRPGLLIPVDLLGHSKYRLIYAAIFGSMSFLFYQVLSGSTPQPTVSDPYAQSIVSILVTLLYVVLICVNYYPLFACVDTPIPIIGHTVGLIFTVFFLVRTILSEYNIYTGCSTGCQAEGLPFFLVLWFFGHIIYDVYILIIPKDRLPVEYNYLHDHLKRVRNRLSSEKEEFSKVKIGLAKVLHTLYPYDSGFKFPLRFLAGMTVAICLVYRLALAFIYTCVGITIELVSFRKALFGVFDELQSENAGSQFGSLLDFVEPYVRIIGHFAVVLGSFVTITGIVSTVFCGVQTFLTFRNASEHLHKSTRGDLSFLPSKEFPTLHRSLLSSFRYPGYVIAYSVWAWLVYSLVFMLIVIVLGIAALILYLFIGYFGPQIAVMVIGLAWTQGLYWSQFFFTKFVFLQKAYPDSEHMVLKNRRLMHYLTYFLLFQNAFVGIFSTFIRIIMSLVFGLLTFSRLDKVLLIRGFESFDAANRTYVGMLYLDYSQNNSVVNVFCHLLLEEIKRKKQLAGEIVTGGEDPCGCIRRRQQGNMAELFHNASDKYNTDADETYKDPPRPLVSQRAYNRWRVAYTLIRNESLIEYTASSLALHEDRRKSLREKLDLLNEDNSDEQGAINMAALQQDYTDDCEKM